MSMECQQKNKVILFDFFGVISSEVSPIFFKRYFNEEEAKKVKEEIQAKGTAAVTNKKKETASEKFNKLAMEATTQKITSRDIRIFTQNFYLLKKAGFNNIHALKTVAQTTENVSFKYIVEDILIGVESGDYMYKTMEYYNNIFIF